MQVLNLRREFEALRINDDKTVKEFTYKVMKIMNQIRVMGRNSQTKES